MDIAWTIGVIAAVGLVVTVAREVSAVLPQRSLFSQVSSSVHGPSPIEHGSSGLQSSSGVPGSAEK